jgi:hypothetical protein
MSDIRINPIQDKTLLILKRIQSQLSMYRGYKAGADILIPSKIIHDEIMKRAEISSTNLRAAISNLESYGKMEDKKKGEELLSRIDGIRSLKIQFPDKQIPAKQEDIERLYSEDDEGFGNARELLDNINSFRSASISGDYDPIVYNKIVENLENINKYLKMRAEFIGRS